MTYVAGRGTMEFAIPTASLDAISFFSLFSASHHTLFTHPAGMALRNIFNAAAPPNPPQCGGTAPLRYTA
jgi:hypothetical protein